MYLSVEYCDDTVTLNIMIVIHRGAVEWYEKLAGIR
jgi:hypothetical protein